VAASLGVGWKPSVVRQVSLCDGVFSVGMNVFASLGRLVRTPAGVTLTARPKWRNKRRDCLLYDELPAVE